MDLLLDDMYVYKPQEGIVSGACCSARIYGVVCQARFRVWRLFSDALEPHPKLNTTLQSLLLLDDIHFDASPHR
jgi:hypothetical protein